MTKDKFLQAEKILNRLRQHDEEQDAIQNVRSNNHDRIVLRGEYLTKEILDLYAAGVQAAIDADKKALEQL